MKHDLHVLAWPINFLTSISATHRAYTLDDREKVELYSCKEVTFLEVGSDVVEVEEIGRKKM